MLGGVLAVLGRPLAGRPLAACLGLAAGVMAAVSVLELLPTAAGDLAEAVGSAGVPLALAAGAAGSLLYLVLDRLVPSPLQAAASQDVDDALRLRRLGLVTAVAIGAHNVPEGFVTFSGTLQDPSLGLAVAVAMAIHNVPEGVAVAVPVRQATGSRRRAFAWAAWTGAAEPVGALACWVLLAPLLTPALLAGVHAGVAGVMLALSAHALLPEARRVGGAPAALAGTAAGAAVMALSLHLMAQAASV